MSRHSSRGRRWDAIRMAVLDRDNYRCKSCGKAAGIGGLEVHHVKPKRAGGSDDPGNLQTLCRGCHIRLERRIKNPARAEWEARLGI